jgi:hypothetical protein
VVELRGVVCRFHFASPRWFGFLGKLVQNLVSLKLLLVKSQAVMGERLPQTSIPTKTKTCLFRLRRGKFLAAKRADIQGRRRGTD